MHLCVTVKEFAGQLVHPWGPDEFLYLPGMHASQATPSPAPSGGVYPGIHVQFVMSTAARTYVSVLLGHSVQLSEPDVGLNFPAAHSEQFWPSAPVYPMLHLHPFLCRFASPEKES